jgi:5-methylcytosine-specific restriction protein A
VDQVRRIEQAISKKMKVYGLICVASDPNSSPRKIKEVRSEHLIRLELVREGDQVFGVHRGRILLGEFLNKSAKTNGVADLDAAPPGNDTPDRAFKSGYVVVRDEKVRRGVLTRASGKCEYCGREGFLMLNGRRYLEAHHIIALGNQGRDRMDNVIALCAGHHREAHFGTHAEALEDKFIELVKDLK